MIPVFYNERQIAEAGNRTSPSIEKPKYVVARWQADHGSKIQIIDPLSRDGFASASCGSANADTLSITNIHGGYPVIMRTGAGG